MKHTIAFLTTALLLFTATSFAQPTLKECENEYELENQIIQKDSNH